MLVRKIVNFAKKETVLFAAVLLAFGSMVCVPLDMQYLSYIDYRVLALLFCLMTVMEGFKSTGFFAAVAGKLLEKVKTFRQLYLVLVFLCFFTSMWITNDVALLTFVPFTVLVLRMTGLEQEMIPVIVLQTIAANLGSMTTPVGNPQNLYLYSISGMGIGAFLQIMGPLTLISAGLIFLICLIHKDFPIRQGMLGKEIVGVRKAGENQVLAVLFFISLLSVFRILSWQLLLLIVLVSCIGIKAFCKEKYLPLKADFGRVFHIYRQYGPDLCGKRSVEPGFKWKRASDLIPVQPDDQQCSGSDPVIWFYARVSGSAAGGQHRRSWNLDRFSGKSDFL